MQNAPPSSWTERTGNSIRAVEDQLTGLLARHRLGIHMVEEPGCKFHVADKTLELMDHPRCRDIGRALTESYPRLFSLSLPPSPATERSMVPYDIHEGQFNNYGYLIDLSQDQPNAPRTVRVSHRNLSSMEDHDRKNFALEELVYRGSPHGDFVAQMERHYRALANFHEVLGMNSKEKLTFYDQMEAWRDGILAAMRGPDAGRHSDAQLDMLGKYYEQHPERFAELHGGHDDGIIHDHNEILTACHTDHIKAIVLPSFHGGDPLPRRFYHARVRLQAAIIGLEHHKAGKPLPVMVYDVDAPFDKQLYCMGRNPHELRITALKALQTLGPEGMQALQEYTTNPSSQIHYSWNVNELLNKAERMLGIPLHPEVARTEGPDGWPTRVKQALEALRQPTTPGAGR